VIASGPTASANGFNQFCEQRFYRVLVVRNQRKVAKSPSAGKRRLANQTLEGYFSAMTTTVDAIYEHGKLVLPGPLSLRKNPGVR